MLQFTGKPVDDDRASAYLAIARKASQAVSLCSNTETHRQTLNWLRCGAGMRRCRPVARADLTRPRWRTCCMSGLNTVLEEMTPAVKALVTYLNQSRQSEALAFFTLVQARLENVHDEEQLLGLFVLLSMTAFQGFSMDACAVMMADQVLACAEQVAHTYSVDDETVH